MAIDDNTSYELTGAQVKDLANKIKGKAADNTFVGATPAAPGSKGLVPEPQAGDNTKFLSGDGTWKDVTASITYYLQKQSTAGMSGVSTYIYTDAGRTIPAAPATLVSDFKAGKTILLEYEQTDATTPYNITFQVNSASADGDQTECQYKLLISELNKDTGTYNAVTTQLSATVTAGTEFNGKWTTVRAVLPTVNNGALTIQQNGTTLNTFTANSSDDKTVNIQTITAETVAPAEEVGAITSSMIDWSTMANTYAHASTNTSVQYPISFGNFLTVTVPQTGTYRIESMAHAATNELAQKWYARTRITVNGSVPSTFDPYAESFIAGNSDYYACATISNNGVVSLTQGDVVALQLQSGINNSRCLLQYADLFIQRIS